MSEKAIYKITITNFKKHNPSIKKSYKSTLISNNFCQDPKLGMLPITTRWLFLNLVLTCGDFGGDSIELSSKQLREMLECNRNIDRELDSLQSLQVLSYEKKSFLYKLKEIKVNEKKLKEVTETSKSLESKKENPDKTENLRIWQTYLDAYRLRYGIEPVRNAQVNAQVSNLRKKLGADDACSVVLFYLKHNDAWYLKNTHSFGLCLKDAETLRTQMLRGRAVTMTEARKGESEIKIQQNLIDAQKGGF